MINSRFLHMQKIYWTCINLQPRHHCNTITFNKVINTSYVIILYSIIPHTLYSIIPHT